MLGDERPEVRRKGVKCIESFPGEMKLLAENLIPTIQSDTSEWVVNAAVSVLGRVYRGTSDVELAAFFADLVASESLAMETRRRAYLSFKQTVSSSPSTGFRSLAEMNSAVSDVLFQIDTTKKFNPEKDVDWKILRQYLNHI